MSLLSLLKFSFLSLALVLSFFAFPKISLADEIQLYDGNGEFVAYIDPLDQYTIFTPFGDALAYVDNGAVFNYQGEFLGWYNSGVLWDINGFMVAFTKDSAPPTVKIQEVSDFEKTKKAIPKRSPYRSRVPTQPKLVYQLSTSNSFSNLYRFPVE